MNKNESHISLTFSIISTSLLKFVLIQNVYLNGRLGVEFANTK